MCGGKPADASICESGHMYICPKSYDSDQDNSDLVANSLV